MLLADEFFLIALDDRTGRLRLSSKVFGLGAAGALLGELLLEEREGDRLRVLSQRPPGDALTHGTLDRLLTETVAHPVRTWLVFLARTATEQVADRLWRNGIVRWTGRG